MVFKLMRSRLSSVLHNPQSNRVVLKLPRNKFKMAQAFSASQQLEKKAEASTATVAYKLFAYRAELARRKRRYKPHSEKKLELSLSLIFKNASKNNEYQWNKYFRSSVDAGIYRQKVKFEVALFMAELQSRNKNMDRDTVLQHCKVFYQTLTEGSTTYIDNTSQPETPRLVKIRRKMSCYW